jgi:XisI protein
MDKITNYKDIIRTLSQYIASISPSDANVETQLIMDDERGHYLLYSVGWENNDYREYAPFVHIDIKSDGKVWIQHDGTDLKIALMLVDKGIPKSDIVLGFRSPFRRKEILDFAVG